MLDQNVVLVVAREERLVRTSGNHHGRTTMANDAPNGGCATVRSSKSKAEIAVEGDDVAAAHGNAAKLDAREEGVDVGSVGSDVEADTQRQHTVGMSVEEVLRLGQGGGANDGRVLGPRDSLPQGKVVEPPTRSGAHPRPSLSPSVVQFRVLQKCVAVIQHEGNEVSAGMAHGKEANDANSDLQELIATEVYDYRKRVEST